MVHYNQELCLACVCRTCHNKALNFLPLLSGVWVMYPTSPVEPAKITLLQAVFTVCDTTTDLLAIRKTTADTATGTCQTEYRGKAGSQKPVAFCAQGAKQKVEDSVYVKIKKFSGLLKNLVRFGSYLLYST